MADNKVTLHQRLCTVHIGVFSLFIKNFTARWTKQNSGRNVKYMSNGKRDAVKIKLYNLKQVNKYRPTHNIFDI